MNNDLFNLTPLENYTPPSLPSLYEHKPEQLQKLPLRWQKNAAVIACAGVIGLSMFATGCGQRDELGFHHGGGGPAPVYVAHTTEQETLGIIRAQLENVGLNLTVAPPEYSVEIDVWGRPETVTLDLLNAERRIGVLLDEHWGNEITNDILRMFYEQYELTVIAFNAGWYDVWQFDENIDRYEQKETARENAREQVYDQVQEFIDRLRQDGVL